MSFAYVLNPALANAMRRAFPDKFGVVNPGQELEGFYYDDPQTGARRLKVVRWGEGYTTDCPFCTDTRGRLTVSHRFGIRDAQTGWFGYELWRCYNEECQSELKYRRELQNKLVASWQDGPALRVPCVKQVEKPKLEPVEFPGVLVPLDQLPPSHHARTYVEGERGFDAAELAAKWKVSYAEHVPPRTRGSMSADRIIIPVRDGGAMVGWQARFIGEIDWKAAGIQKYLTYFPKSLCLYGLDEAEKEDVLVVVEGATSVWRYGYGALPLLGKTMSMTQVGLLVERGRNRPLVLIPDSDDPKALGEFCKISTDLQAAGYGGPIGYAPLPPRTDPANLSRDQLRRLVADVVDVCRTKEHPLA